MGIGDFFEFLGVATASIIPGVIPLNSAVDVLGLIEEETGKCLTGSGDDGRCPKQLKAFKLPPPPEKVFVENIDLKNKKNSAALVYLVGGNFRRARSSLDIAMMRIQESFMGKSMAQSPKGREKYIELYQKISGNDPEWFKRYGFATINEVVNVASEVANIQITKNWNIDKEIEYQLLLKIRQKVNEVLAEMDAAVREYRARGFIPSDTENAGKRFSEAFLGTVSRATIPIKEVYGVARDIIPGFADTMDTLENAFEFVKKGLDAFQQWIDDNDIPVLDDIRDWYANLLDFYKSILSKIPIADDIAQALTGKKLNDLDWLDITDAVVSVTNPVYGTVRAGMELNKTLRESLENKDELTEDEFVMLFTSYLQDYLGDIPPSQLDLSELDFQDIEQNLSQPEPQVPMSLINPGFKGSKPAEKIEMVPNTKRKDVNVEPTRVIVRQEEGTCGRPEPPKRIPFCDQMPF